MATEQPTSKPVTPHVVSNRQPLEAPLITRLRPDDQILVIYRVAAR